MNPTRGKPSIEAIDHIVLRTQDLAAMLHFYCEVLGCTEERRLPDSVGLVQLRAGNALIDIVTVDSERGRAGGAPPQQSGRNVDHFCLRIAEFFEADLLIWLDSHHIAHGEFEERYGAGGFGRSLYLQDPEGNTVELRS